MADPVYEVKGTPPDQAELFAERQRMWNRFMQGTTWVIAITALFLVLLAIFVG